MFYRCPTHGWSHWVDQQPNGAGHSMSQHTTAPSFTPARNFHNQSLRGGSAPTPATNNNRYTPYDRVDAPHFNNGHQGNSSNGMVTPGRTPAPALVPAFSRMDTSFTNPASLSRMDTGGSTASFGSPTQQSLPAPSHGHGGHRGDGNVDSWDAATECAGSDDEGEKAILLRAEELATQAHKSSGGSQTQTSPGTPTPAQRRSSRQNDGMPLSQESRGSARSSQVDLLGGEGVGDGDVESDVVIDEEMMAALQPALRLIARRVAEKKDKEHRLKSDGLRKGLEKAMFKLKRAETDIKGKEDDIKRWEEKHSATIEV
ncbi:hypothetical protein HK101_003765 [Irineochytrium annulatum]|nr:hypothetical protein HK101_003765 [Irineochytrium annulatum]